MTKAVEKLLHDAQSLNTSERFELVDALLETTEPSTDPEYLAAWQAEIDHRLAEHDRGLSPSISWEDVQKNLSRKRER